MSARRAPPTAVWLVIIAACAYVIVRAHYVADLSAFLPAHPTPQQQLLVDQLRDGPASRLLLIALEGGAPRERARIAGQLAHRLRADPAFAAVEDGDDPTAAADRALLMNHRYLLSAAITAQRFQPEGLAAALAETVDELASSAGLLEKSLAAEDPTGEMLRILDALGHTRTPATLDGVWLSADGERTLLVAQTAAAGSDTDAQQRDLDAVRNAFRAVIAAGGPAAVPVALRMSGPGVFAVEARATIKRAATRLSMLGSLLVIGVLLSVYRSPVALGLGLLPVVTAALCGVAAVALGFGVVHGITLGFGTTLIGESVDYSVYFFIQSTRAPAAADPGWQRRLWPTVRLGMLTSVCGFASLLPAQFPGLAQLGLYSISGLIAAALTTRFVLPALQPANLRIRDLSPLGGWLERRLLRLRGHPHAVAAAVGALALGMLGVLYQHGGGVWNRELSALNPVPEREQRYDARLRADLGAADVPDLVVVGGADLEAALEAAERTGTVLRGLTEAGVIGDFDTPALYLPSRATQLARRAALPERNTLEAALRRATADVALDPRRLAPFIDAVEQARHAAPLTREDLSGTSLAAGFDALILRREGRVWALLPLHAPSGSGAPALDLGRIASALAAAGLTQAWVLDLKTEADALYAGYLKEAMRLSLVGLGLIAILLIGVLRSPARTARVLLPLGLAVLCVAGTLVLRGEKLTILHLVGMLLIVAVGSNYALFFDRERAAGSPHDSRLTLASLVIANLSTVIAFGLLSFSAVPVLAALGETVAPGALLALLFAALLTNPKAAAHA